MVSFIRQIILFIPLACILCIVCNKGIYGVLQAGPIADVISFFIASVIFLSEYRKLSVVEDSESVETDTVENNYKGKKIVVTISREYGSGGRYVGKLLAEKLGINFYDKEVITLASKSSGLNEGYIEESEQKLVNAKFENNNDDRIFIAEEKVIKKLVKENSCVIVGRCADYILKDQKNVIKIFLYSDDKHKVDRAVKYYNLKRDSALREINKINKLRAKHYKYYTDRDWYDYSNYDLAINVDVLGVSKTADLIKDYISAK